MNGRGVSTWHTGLGTARKEVGGKVIFSQATVILSTGEVPGPEGGLLVGVWSGGSPTPGGGACSGEGCLVRGVVETPPGRLLLRAVRILLECIPVLFTTPVRF